MVYGNLHERYHFIERHVLMNKNQVINDWCVEQLIIMAYFKIVAVKSITGNSHKMHYWTCLSHRHLTDTIYWVSVYSYFWILTMSIKSIKTWEKSRNSRWPPQHCQNVAQFYKQFMSTRYILYLYENLHERYYLFPRRLMSQDQVINAWFVR